MKTTFLLSFLFIVGMTGLSGPASETANNFVVLYSHDEGCVPYEAYPEGGCPHYSIIAARTFSSKEDAITFINGITVETRSFSNNRFGGNLLFSPTTETVTPEGIIGLFKITQIPIEFAATGKKYKDWVTETKEVEKDEHRWKEK